MNDIFISYRREGGATTARLICKALEDKNFRCFFDSESLSFGSFADSIKDNLRNSRNFILILTPGALDRCNSTDDWVRQEIALALELYKTEQIKRIIPIFTNGVTGFPTGLPADISAITEQNAVELNHKDFEANFSRLLDRIHHEKRDQLVNNFLDLHEEGDPDDLESLHRTFMACLSSEDQMRALKSSIKMHWRGEIETLLDIYHESTLRDLSQRLGMSQDGGHSTLVSRIENWLSHDQHDDPNKAISKKILECYIHSIPGQLASLCDQLGLKVDRRSPTKMRNLLSQRLDAELDFTSLYFEQLKTIAHEALGEDMVEGRKRKELIDILTSAYERGRNNMDS